MCVRLFGSVVVVKQSEKPKVFCSSEIELEIKVEGTKCAIKYGWIIHLQIERASWAVTDWISMQWLAAHSIAFDPPVAYKIENIAHRVLKFYRPQTGQS